MATRFELQRPESTYELTADSPKERWAELGGVTFDLRDRNGRFVARIEVLMYVGGEIARIVQGPTDGVVAAISEELCGALRLERQAGALPPWFRIVRSPRELNTGPALGSAGR